MWLVIHSCVMLRHSCPSRRSLYSQCAGAVSHSSFGAGCAHPYLCDAFYARKRLLFLVPVDAARVAPHGGEERDPAWGIWCKGPGHVAGKCALAKQPHRADSAARQKAMGSGSCRCTLLMCSPAGQQTSDCSPHAPGLFPLSSLSL